MCQILVLVEWNIIRMNILSITINTIKTRLWMLSNALVLFKQTATQITVVVFSSAGVTMMRVCALLCCSLLLLSQAVADSHRDGLILIRSERFHASSFTLFPPILPRHKELKWFWLRQLVRQKTWSAIVSYQTLHFTCSTFPCASYAVSTEALFFSAAPFISIVTVIFIMFLPNRPEHRRFLVHWQGNPTRGAVRQKSWEEEQAPALRESQNRQQLMIKQCLDLQHSTLLSTSRLFSIELSVGLVEKKKKKLPVLKCMF